MLAGKDVAKAAGLTYNQYKRLRISTVTAVLKRGFVAMTTVVGWLQNNRKRNRPNRNLWVMTSFYSHIHRSHIKFEYRLQLISN